jgi:NitT/TauT family transport system substrate-binding protein
MGEDYTGSSADVFEKVLTSPPEWIDYSDMVPTINDIKAMSANMVTMNLWKDIPPDLGIFIDPGFVKQAVKSLSDIK